MLIFPERFPINSLRSKTALNDLKILLVEYTTSGLI